MRQVIPFARASVLLAADRAQLVQVPSNLLVLLVQNYRLRAHLLLVQNYRLRAHLVGGGWQVPPNLLALLVQKYIFRARLSKFADRAQLAQAPPILLALLVQKYKCWRRS
jgi:hypothetical protein